MNLCYEFALECKLKQDVFPEVIETLECMTRSREYSFAPPGINCPLFEKIYWKRRNETNDQTVAAIRKVITPRHDWKNIISNYPRAGEQQLPEEFGSTFQHNKLHFRHLSRDDVFFSIWWFLLPWLASISETVGFVGYYCGDFDDQPT